MASNEIPEYSEVVNKIWDILQKDKRVESFDIIAITAAGDSSPLRYEQRNIGLEYWYVNDFYIYLHRKVLERTLDKENEKLFLTTALLLNPNVKTFWNMRREFVLQKELDLSLELRFVNLVLSHRPKSQDAFNYRKWLLKDVIAGKPVDFIVNELHDLQDIAERHPTNNHVPWDYCSWLLNECQLHSEFVELMHAVFILSGQYMCTHPSDASSFSYRQKIIMRIMNDRNRLMYEFLPLYKKTAEEEKFTGFDNEDYYFIGAILYELGLNATLMDFYRNHEGIWCYRRFAVHLWFKVLPTMISEHGKARLKSLTTEEGDIFTVHFNRLQKTFLSKVTDDAFYVNKYKDWIKKFVE